jgi:hypothetical protein
LGVFKRGDVWHIDSYLAAKEPKGKKTKGGKKR